MTMTEGFSRLTQAARTVPISRPAWRTAWVAVVLPARTRSTTSWLVSAFSPSARRPAAIAAADATASRQPVLPQRHSSV